MTSARSTALRLAAGVAVTALALAGCGDTDDGATPTTSASPGTTTATPTPGDSATSEETESAPSTTPSKPPASKPIALSAGVVAGVVTTETDNVAIAPGDTVRIAVKSDVANELHVHGVDQELELAANVKGVLRFTIPDDLAPGVYEVELHDPALLLFTLTLS